MVYVTHDQVEAMSMADRVVLLNRGRIEQNATPVELYEQSGQHVRRALHRHAADEPAAARARPRRRGRSPAPTGPAVAPADCAGLTLGVRPEHIALALRARRARATVAAVEYLGADSLVTCRSGAATLAVRVPGSVGLAPRRRGVARRGRPARSICSSATARAAPSRCRHEAATHARVDSNSLSRRGGKHVADNPFVRALAALAARCIAAAIALAQAPVEVSFYYPVAVGGPITKLIDGFAADFEKENPGIKVKPIYSGTYQDTITKALTAVKGGDPPVTSILLSTDMFTLIDEDAIVPFDELIKTPDDQAWLKSFYPAFMENSQTGGKTWGIPFQRSTIVLYWNKEMFKEAGLDPNRPPANWKEQAEYAQKLTKRDASGKVTQWGMQIPSSGFPYWLFQALAIENGVNLMNAAGTRDLLRQARGDRGAAVLGRSRRASTRCIRRASSSGARRRRTSSRRRWR